MHITNKLLFIPALATTLLFTGCQTNSAHGPLGTRIDSSLLQYASTDARANVATANKARDAANEGVMAAEHEVTEAEGRLAISQESLRVANAELERARVTESVQANDASAVSVREQTQAVRTAEAAVLAHKLDIDVARHRRAVAQQKCELALAKVDLEAAKAVAATERTDLGKIEVTDFERSVRAEEADVKVAEVRLEQATRDAAAGKAAREEMNKKLAERDEAPSRR